MMLDTQDFEFVEAGEPMELGFVPAKPKCRASPGGTIEFASSVSIPSIFIEDDASPKVLDELPTVDSFELLGIDDEMTIFDGEIMDCDDLDAVPMTERDATVPLDLNRLDQRMTPWGTQKAAGSGSLSGCWSTSDNLKC
jgi:hypothetical protein